MSKGRVVRRVIVKATCTWLVLVAGSEVLSAGEIEKAARVERAKGYLAKAMGWAGRMEDADRKAEVYRKIVELRAKAGDEEGVSAAIKLVEDRGEGAKEFDPKFHLAIAEAEKGSYTWATDMAGGVGDATKRILAYLEIVGGQLKSGDKEGAGTTLGKAIGVALEMKDPEKKVWACVRLAEQAMDIGQPGEAKVLLRQARQTAGRMDRVRRLGSLGGTWGVVAAAQVKAGDFDGAKETCALGMKDLEGENDIHRNFWGRDYIAGVQCDLGDLAGARVTLGVGTEATWLESWYGVEAYALLAKKEAKAGDMAMARKDIEEGSTLARGVAPASEKVRAFFIVSGAQVEMGDVEGAKKSGALAEEAAAAIGKDDGYGKDEVSRRVDQVEACLRVAAVWLNVGEKARSRNALMSARELVPDPPEGRGYEAGAYGRIAEALAKAGDTEGADETFTMARQAIVRKGKLAGSSGMSNYQWVVKGQARVSDTGEMDAWLGSLRDPVEAASAHLGAAEGLLTEAEK